MISVVIPHYNNGKYLNELLQSLTAQTYQDFEVIIVDDGSTDNSIEVIKGLQLNYPKLSLVQQANAGPSAARNNGARMAKGAYIAFLDADDLWLPNKLERQIEVLEKTKADLIYCRYLWFNENGRFPNPAINESPSSPFDFWFDTYVTPSNVLINKEKFLEIGGFDERLNGTADVELWYRVAINQLKMKSTDKFDVISRQHTTSMKNRHLYMYEDHLRSYQIVIDLALKKGYVVNDFFYHAQKKLNKMRWYAFQMRRKDLAFSLFLLGFKTLGWRFFSKLTVVQLIKLPFAK